MNRDTKLLLGAGMIAALTMGGFFPTLSLAAPARAGWAERHGKGRPLAKLGELNLTEDQRAKVKETLQAHAPTVKPLLEKLVTERRALQDLIQSGKGDEAAVRAQAAKVAAVAADLAAERAKIAQELRPVLTPEQIEKLQEMKTEFRARGDAVRERIAKRHAAP